MHVLNGYIDCSGKMSDRSERRCEVARKNFLIELKECVNGLKECFALPERMPFLVWKGYLNKLRGTEVLIGHYWPALICAVC